MSFQPVLPSKLAVSGSEDAEQSALFCWAAIMVYQYKVDCLAFMFAIPNGGLRDKITASRLKQTGVKPGVPDVMLPLPWGSYAGLFLELKKLRKGVVSEDQRKYHTELRSRGYCVVVCKGYIESVQAINKYLGLQLPIL